MDLRVAQKNQRLSHYLIDILVIAFAMAIFQEILKLFFSEFIFLLKGLVPFGFLAGGSLHSLGFFLYYTLCESFWGQTLGKRATGCRLIRKDGRSPNLSQIIGRSFIRLLWLDAISYLFGKEVGMHDSVTKTLVVREGEDHRAQPSREASFEHYISSVR